MGWGMDLTDLSSGLANFQQETNQWLEGIGQSVSEASFRTWAQGEARTAAHVFIPAYQRLAGLNHLTAAMLRMYLNSNAPDPQLIAQVAGEIGLSAAFGRLVTTTKSAVDRQVTQMGRVLTQRELDTLARSVINNQYRDPQTGKAIYFYNNDRGLQGVIGGIHNLRVDSVSVTGGQYVIQVAIRDRYDFDNNQNTVGDQDLAAYVSFRQQLDQFIKSGQYREFLVAYHRSLYFADPVIRSRTFAAFMYAIERNGYTPGGVTWEAIVPIRGAMQTR